jgi:hypothetical protein
MTCPTDTLTDTTRTRMDTRRWEIGDVQSRWRRLWVMVTVEEAEAEAEAEGVRMEAVGGVRVRVQVQEGTGMVISRQEEVVVAGAGPGTNSGLNRNVARGLVRTVSFGKRGRTLCFSFLRQSVFWCCRLCVHVGRAADGNGSLYGVDDGTNAVTGRRGKNRCEGDNPCTLYSVHSSTTPPRGADHSRVSQVEDAHNTASTACLKSRRVGNRTTREAVVVQAG